MALNMTIERLCNALRSAGIRGVDAYEKRLLSMEKDAPRLGDFACEGRVALIFQKHGWAVTMRESPDLEGWLDGTYLGIEVKHWRWKADHDPVVETALSSSQHELVRIPRLKETEGQEEDWEQMYRFAKKNCHQYVDDELNVLFFISHTEAHDDSTLEAAGNRYEEELARSSCLPAMTNLNVMMLMTIVDGQQIGPDPRSIYSKFVSGARKAMPSHLQNALREIRYEPPIAAL